MATITVEIVSKTTSEAGTTFVLAASEEEIKRAGFVPYFIDEYFHGALVINPDTEKIPGCATPYGSVVLSKYAGHFTVGILPFVPALTESHIDEPWINKNMWIPYKLVKTTSHPNGTYQLNQLTPDMNVGDTLVFYDKKPADPA